MTRTLIKNAQIVNEDLVFEGDLLIRDQRIERVAKSISAPDANLVDARGCLLIPGMIDDQVHFREPGLAHKGDLATESAAAVAGGITSYLEMPNTHPFVSNAQILEQKLQRASETSIANFGFYFGATNENLEEIKRLKPGHACGIKVFMGSSTQSVLVDNPYYLESIFGAATSVIATHCEDTPTIEANELKAKTRWGNDIPVTEHPNIRSREACLKSSTLAVQIARKQGNRLHILHLTTLDEMDLFTAGAHQNKRITAEVCVHHLFFNDSWYPEKGNFIKCNPAIKSEKDQEALLQAVREDRIDVIATDHAPHTEEEKRQSYFKAPAGLPLVQHALQSLLEQVKKGKLTLAQAVKKTSHAPADVFSIVDRGYLREGYFADLVLIDDKARYQVDQEQVLAKCGWTPFSGLTFNSRIVGTWVNGERLWDNGTLTPKVKGQRLQYMNYD